MERGGSRRRDDLEGPLGDALRPRGPVQFNLFEHDEPGTVVFAIQGELDVLTAPRLAARINSVVRRRPTDVVLDLRETTFMDSVALQVLLRARRRLDRGQRALTVICDEGPVRRVIEMARLVETLGVVPSPGGGP